MPFGLVSGPATRRIDAVGDVHVVDRAALDSVAGGLAAVGEVAPAVTVEHEIVAVAERPVLPVVDEPLDLAGVEVDEVDPRRAGQVAGRAEVALVVLDEADATVVAHDHTTVGPDRGAVR